MIKHVSPGFIVLARTVSIYVPAGIQNVSASWYQLLCINALKSGPKSFGLLL